jgi:hypothetical protein
MIGKSQLRRYFSKKIDLSVYPQSELDKVAMHLHQRPEKLWAFKPRPVHFKPVLHRPVETAPFLRKFQFERFGYFRPYIPLGPAAP